MWNSNVEQPKYFDNNHIIWLKLFQKLRILSVYSDDNNQTQEVYWQIMIGKQITFYSIAPSSSQSRDILFDLSPYSCFRLLRSLVRFYEKYRY